jgi:RelA/SpoT family (p)ppGpp synthetase
MTAPSDADSPTTLPPTEARAQARPPETARAGLDADALVGMVAAYNPRSDGALIRRAYAFGERAHEGQLRRSGEPYFTHPVTVAGILAQQRMDDASIVTALLHDTVEDTRATTAQIRRRFGAEVAALVDGVTKLTNLKMASAEAKQAEDFRRLFMAMSKDLRVILVKLADRLHNMRTIGAVAPEKQVQKARETMDIYAPLAGRMGMQWMREELEDLSFRVLNPEGRNSILRRFVTLTREHGDVMTAITADIEAALAREGIEGEVTGRAKKPFSVWRKMEEKALGFSQLSDVYGFRIITGSVADCYRALGAIHGRWRAVPGRFKDYVSQPKSNGYRSIHTTVSGRDGKRVEVQIRTRQMHEIAEAGVAAHWSYRDGERVSNPFAVDPGSWVRAMTERLSWDDDAAFLEQVKLEMYADKVFCFTPKGEVVKLPKDSTPLDFAYTVHTRIGDRCVGAKVDGLRVPLWTRLRNGQSVDIVTAEGQVPQPGWLDMVVTGRAKAAIRRSLRASRRERFQRLGRELVRVAFEQIGRRPTDKALATAANQMGLPGPAELLERVGAAEVTAREVAATLYPDRTPDSVAAPKGGGVVGLEPGRTPVRGACCQPVPGERIVGITQRGEGVVIHKIDCALLATVEEQPERWVDLRWSPGEHPPIHPVTLELTIANAPAVLGRVCTAIGERGANIADLRFRDRKPDHFLVHIDAELSDAAHLHTVMTALEAESDVAVLRRHREAAGGADGV